MKQNTKPLSKKEPTKVAVDRSQWSKESQRTYETKEFYTTTVWKCRGCNLEFVFTAQEQKKVFEEEKVYIYWCPVLCDGCKQKKQAIGDKVYRCTTRWSANKQELKTDIEFLKNWLSLLEAYAQLTHRRNTYVIWMLETLIRTNAHK